MLKMQRNHFVISRTLLKCLWLKQGLDCPLQTWNKKSPVRRVAGNGARTVEWSVPEPWVVTVLTRNRAN